MKRFAALFLSLLLLAGFGFGCLAADDPEESEAVREQAVEKIGAKLDIPEGLRVFSVSEGLAEEDCLAIGVDKGKMETYLSLVGYDILAIPSGETFRDCSIRYAVRVKDPAYEDLDFRSISSGDLDALAKALISGFPTEEYETAEGDETRFVYFAYDQLGHYYRYATVVDGRMVYIMALTEEHEITEDQLNTLRSIALSLHF